VIERAGDSDTTTILQRGVNVTNGSHTSSWADRFNPYIYKGQTRANDETSGASAHHLRGEVNDPQLEAAGRYRPMLITHSTGQGGPGDVGKRARLECNQRMGRGERVSYTVDEYKTEDGYLWRPNLRVFVEDDWLGIHGWLLVVSVSYRFAPDEAPGCQLELARPEAFDEIDFPARGRGQLWI
jgi:prophage tail gpP-like protein